MGTYVFPIIQKNAPNAVRSGQDPFFVSSALCILSAALAVFLLPDINQVRPIRLNHSIVNSQFVCRTLSPLKMLASASFLPKMATIPQLWAQQDTASVPTKSNQRAHDFRCCTRFTSRTHHCALHPRPLNVTSSPLTHNAPRPGSEPLRDKHR